MPFTRKFYTADHHFGHLNIISDCSRPFSSVEDMDEAMIARWNAVVGASDIVYHLGDFSLSLKDADRVREIFGRLRGRKRLIIGNHDVDNKGRLHPKLAALAWDAEPVATCEVRDGGKRIWLSHYAHRSWPAMHYGSVHFYGHSHGNLPPFGCSRDVGVDLPDVGFTPRTFAELTASMVMEG
jgi:calcineurin-like phosphoesterase family protein